VLSVDDSMRGLLGLRGLASGKESSIDGIAAPSVESRVQGML